MSTPLRTVLLTLLACALSACTLQPVTRSSAAVPATPTATPASDWAELPVSVVASGSQANIDGDQPTYQLASTQASFNALWRSAYGRQMPTPAAPTLGAAHTAVGLFLGRKSTGGYGLKVTRAQGRNGVLRLYVQQTSPKPGMLTTQALTSPWVIVSVPGQYQQLTVQPDHTP